APGLDELIVLGLGRVRILGILRRRLLRLDAIDDLLLVARRDLDLHRRLRIERAQVARTQRAFAALERRDQRAGEHEALAGVDVERVAIATALHAATEHERLRAVVEDDRDGLRRVDELVVLLGLFLHHADALDRAHRG